MWLIGWTLFRLMYANTFPLVPDETNYWQWSRHLALGYHDQAPMIAWAINLSTLIFGHTEFAIRLPSVLAMAIASAYLLLISTRWIGPKTTFSTAILTQGILEFNLGGLLATCDGLQAAAWAGASYHLARAYEGNEWSQWLITGVWFGFGMLSKYTMVIFLPGALAYGVFSAAHRKRLAGISPYVGALVGAAMFMPVIAWNAQHNWNSLRHVAYLGGVNEEFALHLKYFGDYLASQAALLSPIVFLLIVVAWAVIIKERWEKDSWIYPFLFWNSFPVFAGFALLSLHARVQGNWPGTGYLTASILVAAFFASKKTKRSGREEPTSYRMPPQQRPRLEEPHALSKVWPWAIGMSYGITGLVLLQVVWPVLPIPVRLDRTAKEMAGWQQLGEKARQMMLEMPNPKKTFLFGLRYQVASELAFYTPGQPETVSINRWNRPNVYDYWWKDEDLLGWDAIGVTYDPESHKKQLNQVFARVDLPVKLQVFRKTVFSKQQGTSRELVKTFYLYRAYDFRVGLRWMPPEEFDIRKNNYLFP
jgi:undecaprenyl-diphosphatase